MRKEILLRAAYDLLTKCEEAQFVQDACSTHIFYDDAECDGSCLREDIAAELGIGPKTKPILAKGGGK